MNEERELNKFYVPKFEFKLWTAIEGFLFLVNPLFKKKNVISGSEPLDDISIMERVLLRETFIVVIS